MLDVVVLLRTMEDKHYCGELLCLIWRVVILDVAAFLRAMLDKHYCGGLICLI